MSRVPIRARLSLLTALVGLGAVLALGLVTYRHIENELGRAVDSSLREEYGEMVPVVVDPQRSLSEVRLDYEDAGLEIVQVLDAQGRVVDATAGAGDLDAQDLDIVGEGPVTIRLDAVDAPLRVLAAPVTIRGRPQTIVVAASIEATETALAELRTRLVLGGGLAVLGLAAISYALVGLALRPVERMRMQAAAMSPCHPGDRLALPPAHDELRRLGRTFNATIDDLEAAVDERQAFIASASHELRTPLTNLRAELEWAQGADRSAEELRKAVDGAARDTSRLIDLSEALLDLTVLQVGNVEARREPVDLIPLLDEAVAQVEIPDPDRVVVVTGDDLWVRGDGDQLRRVVVNLLDNAVVHGRAPVTVTAAAQGDGVELCVTDQGDGIPDAIRGQAALAFVRADEAHQRPGAGLGLAIADEIVERHGGTIRHTHDDGGTHATVCLPLRVVGQSSAEPKVMATP